MPNTEHKAERRTLTQQEISVIRVASQLLMTMDKNQYLTRTQILERMSIAFMDLFNNYICADEFIEQNYQRWHKIRDEQVKDYMKTHKVQKPKRE